MGSEPERPEIVVADDDLLFSSRLSASLAQLGYRAAVVRSGEALRAALGRPVRAVIVNLAARAFDAVGLVRGLKEGEATRTVPVLGFCGHRDIERSRAAREAGCDAVATNGMVAADLSRVLDALLRPAASG
jgi:CheY-like chemotaxis protein